MDRPQETGCWNCALWSNAGNITKAHGDCRSEDTYERKTPSYHRCPAWKRHVAEGTTGPEKHSGGEWY